MYVSVNVDIQLSNTFALFLEAVVLSSTSHLSRQRRIQNVQGTLPHVTSAQSSKTSAKTSRKSWLKSTYHFLLEVREMCSAAAVQQDLEGAQLLVDDGGLRVVQEAEACYHIAQH